MARKNRRTIRLKRRNVNQRTKRLVGKSRRITRKGKTSRSTNKKSRRRTRKGKTSRRTNKKSRRTNKKSRRRVYPKRLIGGMNESTEVQDSTSFSTIPQILVEKGDGPTSGWEAPSGSSSDKTEYKIYPFKVYVNDEERHSFSVRFSEAKEQHKQLVALLKEEFAEKVFPYYSIDMMRDMVHDDDNVQRRYYELLDYYQSILIYDILILPNVKSILGFDYESLINDSPPVSPVRDDIGSKYMKLASSQKFYKPDETSSDMLTLYQKFTEHSATLISSTENSNVFRVDIHDFGGQSGPEVNVYVFKFNKYDTDGEKTSMETVNLGEVWTSTEGKRSYDSTDCADFFVGSNEMITDPKNNNLIVFKGKENTSGLLTLRTKRGLYLKSFYRIIITGRSTFTGTGPHDTLYDRLFSIMKCMEDMGIYHGDIKTSNFIRNGNMPKIIDLGGIKSKRNIDVRDTDSWTFGDTTPMYVSLFYEKLHELDEEMFEDNHLTRKKILYILLINDRYAFLLMLIEHACDLDTGWINGFGKKSVPQIHDGFWDQFVGEVENKKKDFFQKIFNGFGRIKNLETIDGLYDVCVEWSRENWIRLHPSNTL